MHGRFKKIPEGSRKFWEVPVQEKFHQVLPGSTKFWDIPEDFASF